MAMPLQHIEAAPFGQYELAELRLLYQLYEEAQRSRIANGERLRAILQGRSLAGTDRAPHDADALLKEAASGRHVGAPALLERAYARAMDDELKAAAALRDAVTLHPAWSWLSSVKGIGHLLAARLLSRLDVTRAATPSAFWAYCGLATIPGAAWKCGVCGLEVGYPVGYEPNGPHQKRSATGECGGRLEPVKTRKSVRVAPRRTTLGGRAGYDAKARECCYLIGVSMLRCGSDYRGAYDAERARLARLRPGWTAKRCHLAALRKMEKGFLRDLWVAWRRAVSLPIVAPYYPRTSETSASVPR